VINENEQVTEYTIFAFRERFYTLF